MPAERMHNLEGDADVVTASDRHDSRAGRFPQRFPSVVSMPPVSTHNSPSTWERSLQR